MDSIPATACFASKLRGPVKLWLVICAVSWNNLPISHLHISAFKQSPDMQSAKVSLLVVAGMPADLSDSKRQYHSCKP
jgi:hypothetical protein